MILVMNLKTISKKKMKNLYLQNHGPSGNQENQSSRQMEGSNKESGGSTTL